MRHSLTFPLSWLCIGVCVGLLAACEVPATDPESAAPLSTARLADTDDLMGWPTQGQMLHGSSLESVSFDGGTLNGAELLNLHLEKGELVGEQAFPHPASTPIGVGCSTPTSGVSRDCGWRWEGVGTCAPRSIVHLGAGGCGLGSCTGDAMLRVCVGTRACTYADRLATNNDACSTSCPDVNFMCPAGGTYTVFSAPYQSNASWAVQPAANVGQFPGYQTVRGTDMVNATLYGQSWKMGVSSVDVKILEVSNAQDVTLTDTGAPWSTTAGTFLYSLSLTPRDVNGIAGPEEHCSPSTYLPTDPNQRWAVPMSGVYQESTGLLETGDASRFTFGCHTGVIAKCYRWGYMPWLDTGSGDMQQTHWACTRMARADYCGDGKFHTQDGTHIAFWDQLPPKPLHERPDAGAIPQSMPFEAGWNTSGAVCLSHTRWATMPPPPVGCPLVAPSYLVDGGGVACPPGQYMDKYKNLCATVCDTPEEAVMYQAQGAVRLLNHSGLNGLDGGVPDGG